MKRILTIIALLINIACFSQVKIDSLLNSRGGLVKDTALTIKGTYLTTPTSTSLGFDSSKVVTNVSVNGTGDSVYVYRGEIKTGVINLGAVGGIAANLTAQRMVYASGTSSISTSNAYRVDTAKGYFGINGTPLSPFHVFQQATLPGTVAITSGSPTVTGTGTNFKADFQYSQSITINGETRVILSINSNTSLTMSTNWGSTVSGVGYTNAITGLSSGIFQIANNGSVYEFGNLIMSVQTQNAAIGSGALIANTSGVRNIAIGADALKANTTGSQNVSIGSSNLFTQTTASNNVGIGYSVMPNSTGSSNTGVGSQAMSGNTSGGFNTATGQLALNQNTTGSNNVATGYGALQSNAASGNTAVGYSAAQNNSSATNISSFGLNALNRNTTGSNNTAFGAGSLQSNSTGLSSTGVGVNALVTQGISVASITITNGGTGYTTATIGFSNVAPVLGATATATMSGGVITAITITNPGYGYITTPTITITGNGTGATATAVMTGTGEKNTAIGYDAGYGAYQGVGNVFIGYDVEGKVNNSNKLYISNQNDSSSGLIYGDFSAKTLNINGSLNAGAGVTPAASAVLQASSTTQGFLPPRMTTTQKNAISSPTEGLIVYDLTLHKLCVYTGSAWETVTSL